MKPILKESFYHDGRGPELQKAHYSLNGKLIKAIDYFNPDDEYSPENLKHLLFVKTQVFMFTPEEVYNYETTNINWGQHNGAAMICLGKSEWLKSFAPQHLTTCSHYQVMFYDEFLDIICETVEAKLGSYALNLTNDLP